MDAAPRTTYRAVLASRGFAGLYAGSALGMVGVSLQILAFSVAAYEATRSPFATSAAFAAGFLPQVVGGLVLPSLADRVPPRVLLPAGALLRAGVAAVLAAGVLGIGGGIALVAAATLLQPLFSAGQSGLVARLLTGDRYVLGRSLFTATSMTAQLLGLAAGGAVLQVLGTGAALGVAAGLEAVSAVVLAVGLPALAAPDVARPRWHPGETWAGYRRILAVPALRRLLLLWWTPLSLSVGAESLAVAYAGRHGAGGLLTATLVGGPPLGALLGEVVVGRLCRPALRERLVLPLVLLLGVALLPLALDPVPALAAALLLVGFAGLAYELGGQHAFRDALPPGRESLGFGLLSVGMMTGQGVGPLLAGPLASAVGVGPAMALCGVAILVAAVLLRRAATAPAGPGPATVAA